MGSGKLRLGLGSSLFLLGLLSLIVFGCFSPGGERLSRSKTGRIELPVSEFLEGDLLFKTGQNSLSDLVVQVDGVFSHVGIVVVIGRQAKVVHAVPPGASTGGVVLENIESYVADAKKVGWLRVPGIDAPTRQKIQNYALTQVGKPFDLQFSLQDPKAIYCSELVIRAFNNAGIATHTAGVNLALLPEPIVVPSTLLTGLQIIKIVGY